MRCFSVKMFSGITASSTTGGKVMHVPLAICDGFYKQLM